MPRRHINPDAIRAAASGAAAVPRDVVAARTANARRCLELLLSGGPHAQAGWAGLAGVVNISEAFGELGIGRGGDAPRILREATDTLARIWTHAEERKTWALTLEQRVEVSERCGLLVDLYALQLGSASQSEHERAFNRAKARLESAKRGQYGKGVTVVGRGVMQTESLQWHPVSERMPGADETVIFWFVDRKGRGDWSAGYYFDGEWRDLFDRDVVRGTVTHWAQPEGPK